MNNMYFQKNYAFNHSDHGTKEQHMVQFSLASYVKYVMQEKNKGFICDHFHKSLGQQCYHRFGFHDDLKELFFVSLNEDPTISTTFAKEIFNCSKFKYISIHKKKPQDNTYLGKLTTFQTSSSSSFDFNFIFVFVIQT